MLLPQGPGYLIVDWSIVVSIRAYPFRLRLRPLVFSCHSPEKEIDLVTSLLRVINTNFINQALKRIFKSSVKYIYMWLSYATRL